MSTYYDWPQLVIISFVIKQTFKNVHVYVFVYHLNIDYNLHQVALDFKQIWQHYTCSKNQLNKKNMLINSFYKLLPLHHTFTKNWRALGTVTIAFNMPLKMTITHTTFQNMFDTLLLHAWLKNWQEIIDSKLQWKNLNWLAAFTNCKLIQQMAI